MVAKDSFLDDYIWTIGYYLTLQPNGQLQYLFPSYVDSVLDVNEESDSKIAKVFDRCFKLIHDISCHYIVDQNELENIKGSISEFFIDDMGCKPLLKTHSGKTGDKYLRKSFNNYDTGHIHARWMGIKIVQHFF